MLLLSAPQGEAYDVCLREACHCYQVAASQPQQRRAACTACTSGLPPVSPQTCAGVMAKAKKAAQAAVALKGKAGKKAQPAQKAPPPKVPPPRDLTPPPGCSA